MRNSKSAVSSQVDPWLGFIAAMWVQVAAGYTYSYPLYSNKLKKTLGYSQRQLNNMAVAVDIGQNVGLLAGFMCNKLPPWGMLLIGSCTCFLGHGLLWLVMTGAISPLPYCLMWIAQWMGSNSSTWIITAALITNMRNFPQSRGSVSGILKGLSGLGGAVFTEIFICFLDKDPTALLLFLTLGPFIICLTVMYFVRPYTPTEGDTREQTHLHFIQWMTVTLALYLLISSIAVKVVNFSNHVILKLIGVTMILLIMAPFIIPLKEASEYLEKTPDMKIDNPTEPLLAINGKCQETEISESVNAGTHPDKESSFVSSTHTEIDNKHEVLHNGKSDVLTLLAEGVGAVVRKKKRPKRGENFNLRQALVKADFWLLFTTYLCGAGSGITFLNNLAQIGFAQGYEDVTILLSIIGVCNFLGRLGGGVISEHYIRTHLIPRTLWMAITQILMILCFLLLATATLGSLPVGSSIMGLCFGVQSAIMVPTASEIFGLKHFGKIYNFQTMANPVGALIFSGCLAGYLYDIEAEKQAAGPMCLGSNCFKLTFLVMSAVCAVGVGLGVILTKRLWPVYETLYANASFRIKTEMKATEDV